jgi:hypothetical protein
VRSTCSPTLGPRGSTAAILMAHGFTAEMLGRPGPRRARHSRERDREGGGGQTIEEAAWRGRTTTALTAIEAQRKNREALVDKRRHEAETLADLKAERAALGAKGRQIETEAAPIRYLAKLVGAASPG